MKPEQNLWSRVRKGIGHMGHFQRLEFNPVDGIPDVNFCIPINASPGIEGHIELKCRERAPAREGTAVFGQEPNLREAQEAWIKRRLNNGGRVFILAQIGKCIYLLHGDWAPYFNSMTTLAFEERAVWIGGPLIGAESWRALVYTLASSAPRVAFTSKRKGMIL